MIKKFKNGKINLDLRGDFKKAYYEKTIKSMEIFYNYEMFMEDLAINQINGYLYIIDFNRNFVYDLPAFTYADFLQKLMDDEKIVLYPYSKEVAEDLLQDLENGY